MGTQPSARSGQNNPGGELSAVAPVRSNRDSKGTRASSHRVQCDHDESGQVSDEQVVELAFAVGNHQHVYVMFSVAVFRGVERKDFVVFEVEKIDADCWV